MHLVTLPYRAAPAAPADRHERLSCECTAKVCAACAQAVTHLASASAGAILSAFVRVPTDTLKHRTQAYLIPDVWRVRPFKVQLSFKRHASCRIGSDGNSSSAASLD